MGDLINAEGADISIDFCGYHLKSPYILSSGPLSYSGRGEWSVPTMQERAQL